MSICPQKSFSPHLVISDSVNLVNAEDWDGLVGENNTYLSRVYLQVLEQVMSTEMEFRYVIYYCEDYKPIGIAYFQSVDLEDKGSQYSDRVRRLGEKLGSKALKELKARILLNGNVFHCGENGFLFSDMVPQEQRVRLIDDTLNRLKGDQEMETRPTFLMLKEYRQEYREWVEPVMRDLHYHDLHMDVNMCMDIPEEWTSFEDYMSALTSKARTRVKRIRNVSSKIVIEDWDAGQIDLHIETIDRLFQNILNTSVFQFGRLDVKCYVEWKKNLGDKLRFRAYLLDGTLVGFSTAFRVNGFIEAQYVGFDVELNTSHSIYLRMLLQYLEDSILEGATRLNLGRTAEQAKSTLGAVPVDMMLYVHHRSRLANRFLGPILRAVKPSEFEQRSPFKKAD